MSQENVEIVRAHYERFNATGEPDWELFHPDAEFDASAIPGIDVVRGREGVMRLLREYAAAFEDWRIEPQEIRDAGGPLVLAVVRDGGRMKDGGAEVYNVFTDLWTFRGGQVVRWQAFTNKREALEAAGLSE